VAGHGAVIGLGAPLGDVDRVGELTFADGEQVAGARPSFSRQSSLSLGTPIRI